MDSPFSLKNKTILVTGASSGIGRACAIECAKFGAKIILTARDAERLSETLSNIMPRGSSSSSQSDEEQKHHSAGAEGGKVTGAISILADLSDDAGIEKVVASVSEPLDGIVHCAGINKLRPFTFAARKHFEETLQINTFAPLELTRMLLKKNLVKDGASIVFMSSISGTRVGTTGHATYAASKAALCGVAKTMAIELAQRKIRVNCICPGVIETPMATYLNDEERVASIKKYPLSRYGLPEEVAYAAIYFLSDAAAWTTGSELVIDGGRTLA